MKLRMLPTITLSLLVSTSAFSDEVFCKRLQNSLPGMYEIGVDVLSITKGKEGECENYSDEEWNKMLSELNDTGGVIIGTKYALPDAYALIIGKAKETVRKSGKTMSLNELQNLAIDMTTKK